MSNPSIPAACIDQVEQLHRVVDAMVGPLEKLYSGKLQCGRGCAACCIDGISVFEVEAARIRRDHADLLETAAPRAPGACAFLNAEGACRIYESRPYVCRTQGLPLRWHEADGEGELSEYRDICELNVEVGPLEDLAPEGCWTVGAVEEKLAQVQRQADGGELRRVPLRELFDCT